MKISEIKRNFISKKIIENSLNNKKISHSYIVTGEENSPKEILAELFAKGILCKGESSPCDVCLSCKKFDGNNHPDFSKIKVIDGKASISIEQIRNVLKEAYLKPNESDKRVYIIYDAHLMTEQAQNALLKFFEEPPFFSVIILVAKDVNLLLETIKSRALIINAEPEEDISYSIKNEYSLDYLDRFSDKNEAECLDIILDNIKSSEDFVDFLNDLKILLRDICIFKNVNSPNLMTGKNKELQISQISYKITDIQSQKLMEICDDFILRIYEYANLKLSLCAFNAKCWEEIR